MSNEVVGFTLGDAQVQVLNGVIASLKQVMPGAVALTPGQKRLLKRMGAQSEAFCRQVLNVLDSNRRLVPEKIGLDAAIEKFRVMEAVRPRLLELSQLLECWWDNDAALGSEVMTAALQGYGLLKMLGRSEGLEPLRRELQATRFKQTSRQAKARARLGSDATAGEPESSAG
jgi:hypothetical protein